MMYEFVAFKGLRGSGISARNKLSRIFSIIVSGIRSHP